MDMSIETVLAVSLSLSVFSAVAAMGISLVFGIGFERLRAGFETIAKQTGFFSDMLNKLEQKVEQADGQAAQASKTARNLELKIDGLTEQANIFAGSLQNLAERAGASGSLQTAGHENARVEQEKALLLAKQAEEAKQKQAVRERMYAIAKEMDQPAMLLDRVNGLPRWNKEDDHRSSIHIN